MVVLDSIDEEILAQKIVIATGAYANFTDPIKVANILGVVFTIL